MARKVPRWKIKQMRREDEAARRPVEAGNPQHKLPGPPQPVVGATCMLLPQKKFQIPLTAVWNCAILII